MSENEDNKPTMKVQYLEDIQNVAVTFENCKSFEFMLAMIELTKLAVIEKRNEVKMQQQMTGIQQAQLTQDLLGNLRSLPKRTM